MNIAVIGAGSVGATLGRRWLDAGHKVVFGVRRPDDGKYEALRKHGAGLKSLKDAARTTDLVVLATPWSATEEAVRACGDLDGKVVVDCTNPLTPDLSGLTHAAKDSGGEQVARWARGAKVVKAFNTVGFGVMDSPRFESGKAVMFICGDDDGKRPVRELSDILGFETVDAGPLKNARLLEPFALLWITGAFQLGLGRDYAFRLLRRNED